MTFDEWWSETGAAELSYLTPDARGIAVTAWKAAHREGWEQAKREAAEIANKCRYNTSMLTSLPPQSAAAHFINAAICDMEYKGD